MTVATRNISFMDYDGFFASKDTRKDLITSRGPKGYRRELERASFFRPIVSKSALMSRSNPGRDAGRCLCVLLALQNARSGELDTG